MDVKQILTCLLSSQSDIPTTNLEYCQNLHTQSAIKILVNNEKIPGSGSPGIKEMRILKQNGITYMNYDEARQEFIQFLAERNIDVHNI